MKNYAIILASGTGSRFRREGLTPKQFSKIAGKSILEHTIEIFEKAPQINETILVILPESRLLVEEILLKNHYKKITKILNGGETRKESSYIGVMSINDVEANVLIHDCARPFLSQDIIARCIQSLETYNAIDVAIPATDTIIEVSPLGFIHNIPKRDKLMCGQTPQCFKLSLIKKAHQMAINDNDFTDDCGLILKYNLGKIFVVEGESENIKITYAQDIVLADKLFQTKAVFAHVINLSKLSGCTLVVFGGTSGIGKSIVEIAQNHQSQVFALSKRNGCDVTSFDSIQSSLASIFQQCGKIDYIVNCAGILHFGALFERDYCDIRHEIEVNYFGSINIIKASLPYLLQNPNGASIALFTSSSYTRGRALYSVYSSTKAAITNLGQGLAEELSNENIRVNIINPARTATPMRTSNFGKEPLENLLDPAVVAQTTLFTLLSDLSGQVIDVRKD